MLIGGGEIGTNDVQIARAIAPVCVAVDGGADAALTAGLDVEAVIGDMDSISDTARARVPPERFHHIAEQDSTDFDKALRSVSAPAVVAVGFGGGRMDHALAALHTMTVRADIAVVMLCAQDIIFMCPPAFELQMDPGTRVSLFPMGPVTGRSQGLNWPIDGLSFAPGVQSGTSNHATGAIRLEMDQPGMLCILPRQFIQPVVSLLAALPVHARWPARAERYTSLQPS